LWHYLYIKIVKGLVLSNQSIDMKSIFLFAAICFVSITASAQEKKAGVVDSTKAIQTVEASCGQCQFKMKATGCDLAVRIKGNSYFVEGVKIDELGDAHADDGFCNAIRKAEVQGVVKKGKFQATYFKLLPADKKH
jgi:hypothetical protein